MLNLKETYYLAGALRDGSISVQNQIKVKQKSRLWLSLVVIPAFNKVFGLSLTERAIYLQDEDKNLRYYLLFKSKNVWKVLQEIFEMPRNQTFWQTPKFVKRAPNSLVKYYIQGFVDAEGGTPRKVIVGSKLYLHISQKNREALEFLKVKLQEFKVKSGKVCLSDRKSNTLRISITGKQSMLNYIKTIGTQHPDKAERFKAMLTLLKVR